MPVHATAWHDTYRVRAYEATPDGHASLQTLCNYLQETAGTHASALGLSVEHLGAQNLTWVLARLHVQVEVFPRWREDVRVETWPSGEDGLSATREFLLWGKGDRRLGRASSAWMLLDLARRRPVRLSALIGELRVPDRTYPIPDAFPRLPPLERVDHEQAFQVRYSDLDLNGHVNNVRYVEWIVEAVPQALLTASQPVALEINFRAETAYGDAIVAQTQQAEDGEVPVLLHRLLRAGDGREVTLARTRWRRTA